MDISGINGAPTRTRNTDLLTTNIASVTLVGILPNYENSIHAKIYL